MGVGSGRKQGVISRIVDFLLDHTVVYMNFKKRCELQEIIDAKDDARRDKFYEGLDKFIMHMEVSAKRNKDEVQMKQIKSFKEFLIKDKKLAEHYENLDDEARRTNISMVAEALERNRDTTYAYEEGMIELGTEAIA